MPTLDDLPSQRVATTGAFLAVGCLAEFTNPRQMGPRIRRGYPSDLRPRHTRTTTGTTSASIDSVSSVKSGRVKTGTPHIVPLARQSVEILRELHPLTGHGRYIFPNARYPHRERPMSEATLWGALRALDVRPDRMTMHGFRAMGRTTGTTENSGRGVGFPAGLYRASVGPRRTRSQWTGLQPDSVLTGTTENDAELGRLSGPVRWPRSVGQLGGLFKVYPVRLSLIPPKSPWIDLPVAVAAPVGMWARRVAACPSYPQAGRRGRPRPGVSHRAPSVAFRCCRSRSTRR